MWISGTKKLYKWTHILYQILFQSSEKYEIPGTAQNLRSTSAAVNVFFGKEGKAGARTVFRCRKMKMEFAKNKQSSTMIAAVVLMATLQTTWAFSPGSMLVTRTRSVSFETGARSLSMQAFSRRKVLGTL